MPAILNVNGTTMKDPNGTNLKGNPAKREAMKAQIINRNDNNKGVNTPSIKNRTRRGKSPIVILNFFGVLRSSIGPEFSFDWRDLASLRSLEY